MARLRDARVAVFGIGGVGSFTAEALVRAGVGALDLVDHDRVAVSNLNRQLFATLPAVGQYKVDAARERLLAINPQLRLTLHRLFYTPESAGEFDLSPYDYLVDAIDTVSGKLELAVRAHAAGVPLIASMGAGNKLDPTAFRVADIYETSVCPLARIMRRELRRRGIPALKVVYSQEPPLTPLEAPEPEEDAGRKIPPGSVSFVPSAAGLILAGEVVRDLIGRDRREE